MQIRRPLAVLVAGVALVAGGALAGCTAPSSGYTGTPMDNAVNTHGNDPGGKSQGNLPQLSDQAPSAGPSRAGGNAVGVP